jgi:hypothetical protein
VMRSRDRPLMVRKCENTRTESHGAHQRVFDGSKYGYPYPYPVCKPVQNPWVYPYPCRTLGGPQEKRWWWYWGASDIDKLSDSSYYPDWAMQMEALLEEKKV